VTIAQGWRVRAGLSHYEGRDCVLYKRTMKKGRQTGVSRTEILRTRISPLMAIEGACVLEAWLGKDQDFHGLSSQDVVSQIYAAMEVAQSRQLL